MRRSEDSWLRLVLQACNMTLEDARTGPDTLADYIPQLEALRDRIMDQLGEEPEARLPDNANHS